MRTVGALTNTKILVPDGSFHKSGSLFVGVLIVSARLFGVYTRILDLETPISWCHIPSRATKSDTSNTPEQDVAKYFGLYVRPRAPRWVFFVWTGWPILKPRSLEPPKISKCKPERLRRSFLGILCVDVAKCSHNACQALNFGNRTVFIVAGRLLCRAGLGMCRFECIQLLNRGHNSRRVSF